MVTSVCQPRYVGPVCLNTHESFAAVNLILGYCDLDLSE